MFFKLVQNSTAFGIELELTPSEVIAPIGTQVMFTCKYHKELSPDLYISIESLVYVVYDLKERRYSGGAETSFYIVVGIIQQTIRCVVRNKDMQEVGSIKAFVSPGLKINQSTKKTLFVLIRFIVYLELLNFGSFFFVCLRWYHWKAVKFRKVYVNSGVNHSI